MSLARQEFLDILILARHMAGADGELHPMEKKVLHALFKAMDITPEESSAMRSNLSVSKAIRDLKSEEAKNVLIDVLVLVASADGKFEEDERIFISKVMHRFGIEPEGHPYFREGGELNVEEIRSNVRVIIENIKELSHH